MIRNPLTIVLLAFLTLPFFLVACGDDESPTCPVYEVGVLEGVITSGGEGLLVEVEARPRGGDNPFHGYVEARTDSTGYYRMELPSGLYQIEIQEIAGGHWYWTASDTMRITPGTTRYDQARGRLVLRLTMPDDFENYGFRLECYADNRQVASTSEKVVDGILEYDMNLLPPDSYQLELSSYRTGDFYLPGVIDRDLGTVVEVGSEEITRHEQDLALTAATIGGQVVGSWAQDGSGSFGVSAYSLNGRKMGRTSCTEDGSFSLSILADDPFLVQTDNNGIFRWIGGNSQETATVFDLQPGEAVTDLVHEESGLKVRLEGPGNTVKHQAEIVILDETGWEYRANSYGRSTLYLSNLPAGRYRLFADGSCEDQVWAPMWYGGNEDITSAVAIDLAPGEMKPLVLDLVEGGRLEGGINTPPGLGEPVEGYRIYDETRESLCYTRSWAGGGLHYTGLPDGTYYVSAVIYSAGPWYYPGTWDSDLAEPVTLTDHPTVRVEWDLPGIIPEVVR